MNTTEVRDTLTTVSDALLVPAPDQLAFQRRVGRLRRRRTAGRVAGTAAVLALVAGGTAVALDRATAPTPLAPAHEAASEGPAAVPLVVDGHLRMLGSDGRLEPEAGPEVATVVGTTPRGVVVVSPDGTLGRVDRGSGRVEQLVPETVRSAYLDGTGVTYEDDAGLIHFWGITPRVMSSDSAHTDEGRLWAAGGDVYVETGGNAGGLSVHTADGIRELRFEVVPTVLHQVQVGGDVVAVRVDDRVVFFDLTGRQLAEQHGEPMGALAPQGHFYAQIAPGGDGVQLVDPTSGDISTAAGPSTTVEEIGWAPDGDLLVVVSGALWRCSGTTDCRVVLTTDDVGPLRLR